MKQAEGSATPSSIGGNPGAGNEIEETEAPHAQAGTGESAVSNSDLQKQPNPASQEQGKKDPPQPAEAEPFPATERAVTWKRRMPFAALAAALLLCLIFGGTGIALGWFSPSHALMQTTQEAASPSAESGTAVSGGKKEDASKKEKEEQAPGSSQKDSAAMSDVTSAASGSGAGSAAAESRSSDGAPAEESTFSNTADTAAAVSEPASEPAPEPTPQAPATITVSVYVDSSQAVSFGYPACLASTSVTLNPGASVFDALCATGVSVGGSSSYVGSIGGLSEFACGAGSGWLYYVNGSSPGYGPGAYALYGGESITWHYTLQV